MKKGIYSFLVIIIILAPCLFFASEPLNHHLTQLAKEREGRAKKANQSSVPTCAQPQAAVASQDRASYTHKFKNMLIEDRTNHRHDNDLAYVTFLMEIFEKFAQAFCIDDDKPRGYRQLEELAKKTADAHIFFEYLRSHDIENNELIMNVLREEINMLINFRLYRIAETDSNITVDTIKEACLWAINNADYAALSCIARDLLSKFKIDFDFFVDLLNNFDSAIQHKQVRLIVELNRILRKHIAYQVIDSKIKEILHNWDKFNSLDTIWLITLMNIFDQPDSVLSSRALIKLQCRIPEAKKLMSYDLYEKYQEAQENMNVEGFQKIKRELIDCGFEVDYIDTQINLMDEYLKSRHVSGITDSATSTAVNDHMPAVPSAPPQTIIPSEQPVKHIQINNNREAIQQKWNQARRQNNITALRLLQAEAVKFGVIDESSDMSLTHELANALIMSLEPDPVKPQPQKQELKKSETQKSDPKAQGQERSSAVANFIWGKQHKDNFFTAEGLKYGKDAGNHEVADDRQALRTALSRQGENVGTAVGNVYRRTTLLGVLAGLIGFGVTYKFCNFTQHKNLALSGAVGLVTAGLSALYLSYRHGIHTLRTGERRKYLVEKTRQARQHSPHEVTSLFNDFGYSWKNLAIFGPAGLAHIRGIIKEACS